jgi:dihydrofolate synthase/folylpolyglutamate synthase
MLADKDIRGVLTALQDRVDAWYLAPLPVARGASATQLSEEFAALGMSAGLYSDVVSAWHAACQEAGPADTIVAFGSFYTVADILELSRNDG